MLNKLFFIAGLVAVFSSCTKNTDLNISADRAIVQAYLAANHPIDILVTKEISLSDSTASAQTLDNLTINFAVNGKNYILTKAGNGHYTSNNIVINTADICTMSFTYNGNNVTAKTGIPSKPQNFKSSVTTIAVPIVGAFNPNAPPVFPDPIQLTWTNDTKDFYLVVVQNTETSPTLINPEGNGFERTNRFFRLTPTQANNQQIRAQQFQYFGSHNMILYHVDADYASLYNSNGTNSTNLTAPFTNVTNGLGIFTGINADTLPLSVSRK